MEREREYKMSDVVAPSTSRTIRRIPINRKQAEEETVEEFARPRRSHSRPPRDIEPNGSSLFTKITLVAVVVVSIIAIAAAISLAYSKGTLSIEPKKLETSISTTFTSNPGGQEGLKYTTVTASDSSMEVVAAKLGTFVQAKAKGSVTIVNTSAEEQQLVINTRIESSTGKIYRITKPLVIPPQKRVSVPVIAEESGDSYNLSKADAGKLKIPGFKGSKKYDQFYAELDADITGGFSGNKNVIDPVVYKEVRSRLVASAHELVKAKLRAQVDKNSTYIDTLVVITDEDLPDVAKGGTQSQISVKATGIAYIFDTKELVQVLGASEVKKLGANSFKAENLSDIAISSKNPLKYSPTAILTLSAAGKLSIVGDIPSEQIKKELLGVKVSEINDLLKKYDGISKASIKVSPFWKNTFPNAIERIVIEIK
jgi:hypothetical protein